MPKLDQEDIRRRLKRAEELGSINKYGPQTPPKLPDPRGWWERSSNTWDDDDKGMWVQALMKEKDLDQESAERALGKRLELDTKERDLPLEKPLIDPIDALSVGAGITKLGLKLGAKAATKFAAGEIAAASVDATLRNTVGPDWMGKAAAAEYGGIDLVTWAALENTVSKVVKGTGLDKTKYGMFARVLFTTALATSIIGARHGDTGKELLTERLPEELLFNTLALGVIPAIAGAAKGAKEGALKVAMATQKVKNSKGAQWLEGALTPMKDKFLSLKVVPKGLEDAVGGRTVKQLLIPAEERMPHAAAEGFRKLARSDSMIRQARTKMAEAMKDMDIDGRQWMDSFFKSGNFERSEVFNEGYFRLTQDSRKRIMDALTQLEEWKTYSAFKDPKLESMRLEQIRLHLRGAFKNKSEVELLNLTTGQKDYELVAGLVREGSNYDMNKTQKALKAIIKNTEDPTVEAIAKDWHNLTANTMDTLPSAVFDAEQDILFANLRKNRKLVVNPSKLPEADQRKAIIGLVKSKHPKFRDEWVQPDVEDALTGFTKMPGLVHDAYNRLLLGPWKLGKVVLRVPTHFRNVFSNMILNDWGGLPFYRQDLYLKAAKDIRQNSTRLKEFKKLTGFATTFGEVETSHLPISLRHDAGTIEVMEHYLRNLTKPFAQAYQMEETWGKYAKYLWNMDHAGMTKKEAARDAVKWTFNYGEVTPFVRTLRTTLMPFATWQFKVLPLFIESLIKHPLRVAKWGMLPAGINAAALKTMDISDQEWEHTRKMYPDWMKNGMMSMMPFRDSQDRLNMLNFTWMLPGFGDLADIGTSNPVSTIVQNPFVSLAADLTKNKQFSGAPIWYDWEPNSVKMWRALSHSYMQLAPAIVSNDLISGVRTAKDFFEGGDYENKLTPEMFALSQVGLRTHPIDEKKLRKGYKTRKRIEVSEIKSQLKKALKGKKGAERDKIIQKYKTYLLRSAQD